MNSRYDFVQDPESRRAVAIVRAGAASTIVAALFGLSLLNAPATPGPSVSEAFGNETAAFIDARPTDAVSTPDEPAQPPRYMGEAAVY